MQGELAMQWRNEKAETKRSIDTSFNINGHLSQSYLRTYFFKKKPAPF